MTISEGKIYPRTGDAQTVYLKSVVTKAGIEVGDYTMYNDFVRDPRDFEKNNVLYHYPVNGDRLKIGRFCSVACGTKFLFASANHTMRSLSTYPFLKIARCRKLQFPKRAIPFASATCCDADCPIGQFRKKLSVKISCAISAAYFNRSRYFSRNGDWTWRMLRTHGTTRATS